MVLHLSTFHLEGGAGVAATRLHRALLKQGVDSHLLVPTLQAPEPGVLALAHSKWQQRQKFGLFVAERLAFFPHEKNKSVRFAFSPAAVGFDITDHPLVRQASVLHLHWINFGFLSINGLKKLFRLNKPIVWTLHDMWAFTGGCHYTRGCERYLHNCGYCPYLKTAHEYDISFDQFFDKTKLYANKDITLISPSRWLNDLVRNAPLTAQLNAQSIPNCIDTALFRPLEKSEIRSELGLPADKKLVLFTGANTQDPRKGFVYIREAMASISHHGVEVVVFGKADPQAFADFPVRVHYLGKISQSENLVKAYNAADMIVVPSLEDNLPNTIMEAMACGTPAVGFATGGIPEMIDHRINGFVAGSKSAAELGEGISWILENGGGSFSEKARRKVLDTYSEATVAAKYQQLYQSLTHA